MTAPVRSLPSTRRPEPVEWSRQTAGDLTLLRVGTQPQNVLGSCGDDHRINWGYAYAAAPSAALKRGDRRSDGPGKARSSRTAVLPAADDAACPARPTIASR